MVNPDRAFWIGKYTDPKMQENKSKVQSRYPNAMAEPDGFKYGTGGWAVWDMSEFERQRQKNKYLPHRVSRTLLGMGLTESEAWLEAVRSIERQEGRRLKSCRNDY